MKTIIVMEVEHDHDIPALADMIAGRAYTISGVSNADVVQTVDALPVVEPEMLMSMGFTLEEISLGSQDVERG